MMLIDFIDTIAKRWMKDPDTQHWWGLAALSATVVDALVEGVYQGRKAGLPNQVNLPGVPGLGGFDSVDALPRIGRDRMTPEGLAELPWDYAGRLRQYRASWAASGTPAGMLAALAGILGPNVPKMRIVTEAGRWWTRDPDGTLHYQTPDGDGITYNLDGTTTPDTTVAHAWIWDASTFPAPPDQNEAGRWWLIVYPPASGPYLTDTDRTTADPGLVGDGWNDLVHGGYEQSPDAGTGGTNAPYKLVELARGTIAGQRAPGYPCEFIVIAFDAASFNPDSSSGGTHPYPDGTWGYDHATGTGLPTRCPTAEYWPGIPGGFH